MYACYQILFREDDNYTIGLEGIEDIDILHNDEYIQVKSSKNRIDASKFWSMGVLKNYLEVYIENSNANFLFVHNTTIVQGNLSDIEKKKYNKKSLEFWKEKIETLSGGKDIDIQDFLQKITFIKVNKEVLYGECKQLLLEKGLDNFSGIKVC